MFEQPVKYLRYRGGYQIGGSRAAFPGTDALQLNAQPLVMDWLRSLPGEALVVAEGDRLANHKFFDFVETELGWRLDILYFAVDRDVLHRRRAERELAVGAAQDPTWVLGRDTKHERLWRTRFAPYVDNTNYAAVDYLTNLEIISCIRKDTFHGNRLPRAATSYCPRAERGRAGSHRTGGTAGR